jgi:hypothetical protein
MLSGFIINLTSLVKNMPDRTTDPAPAAEALAMRLDGRRIGAFGLVITEMRPIRPRSGWRYVKLSIRDKRGKISSGSLMTGIVSAGGRGVKPWIECRLFPIVISGDSPCKTVDARALGLEARMIDLIGDLIPPGGHLMIDYENPGQEETFAELVLRVPPPASYLGSLMFQAGFRGAFKDWYFSEGGHEGPRKLQANKSPDQAAARRAIANHRGELSAFVARALPTDSAQAKMVRRAQARARDLLKNRSLWVVQVD